MVKNTNDLFKSMAPLGRSIFLVNQKQDILFNKCVSSMGITTNQFRVLSTIRREKIITPCRLKEYLSVDAGSITRMITRLESKKLIKRIPNPDDKRSFQVKLTKKGIDICEECYIAYGQTSHNELVQNLTDDEVNTLKQLLKQILE